MLKVATWNVNSVNSRLERLLQFLKRESPDVLCLQELKCMEEKFPFEPIRAAGYDVAVYGQKTYNGVAILSKQPITQVQKGFGDGVDDPAARFILGYCEKLWVASAYVPNGQTVGSAAYEYKLKWYARLESLLKSRFTPGDSLLVAGDFNVAPEDRDCHNPTEWEGAVLFSEPEKAALKSLCRFGLVDTFRLHHQDSGLYSWWDYRQLAFPFNKGLRIDFILASSSLASVCNDASIDRDERKGEKPSDHAPCLATFRI